MLLPHLQTFTPTGDGNIICALVLVPKHIIYKPLPRQGTETVNKGYYINPITVIYKPLPRQGTETGLLREFGYRKPLIYKPLPRQGTETISFGTIYGVAFIYKPLPRQGTETDYIKEEEEEEEIYKPLPRQGTETISRSSSHAPSECSYLQTFTPTGDGNPQRYKYVLGTG